MSKKRKWKRVRSHTADVEMRSVLLPLKVMAIHARSFEHRMALFTKRWHIRFEEMMADQNLPDALRTAILFCPPCSLKNTTTTACDFRFCPYCFARANAAVFQRWRLHQGTSLLGFNDRTHAAVVISSRAILTQTREAVEKSVRRLKYQLRDADGGVIRITPVPLPEPSVWSFRISGVAVYSQAPPMLNIVGEAWQSASTVANMISHMSRALPYPEEWFTAPAARVATAYSALQRMRFIRCFGNLYSREADAISDAVSSPGSGVAADAGHATRDLDCDAGGTFAVERSTADPADG